MNEPRAIAVLAVAGVIAWGGFLVWVVVALGFSVFWLGA
jgi:hypothetical protein